MALAQDPSLSTAATEETEDEKKRKKKKAGQQKATGAAAGAASGATAGSVAGPIGALAGAAIGAGASLAESNQAEKAAGDDPNRPKRRRLTKGLERFEQEKQKRERALATLSQAVFDWAASIR